MSVFGLVSWALKQVLKLIFSGFTPRGSIHGKKVYDESATKRQMTLGMIVGNRGFFPDHRLAPGTRKCGPRWSPRE